MGTHGRGRVASALVGSVAQRVLHGARPRVIRGAARARRVRRVVLTGGPGAGKTAVFEVVRHHACAHVAFVREAATVVYSGGFPRDAVRPAQRAIFHVQRELEAAASEEDGALVMLCDRGTVDGAAYWPGNPDELWRDVGTTRAAELARYDAVIHLRTPAPTAYNHANPVRVESAVEAAAIDRRIDAAWDGQPRRTSSTAGPTSSTRCAARCRRSARSCRPSASPAAARGTRADVLGVRRASVTFGAAAVLVELVLDLARRDAEELRGLRRGAAGGLERLQDRVALQLGERRAGDARLVRIGADGGGHTGVARRRWCPEQRRAEIDGADRARRGRRRRHARSRSRARARCPAMGSRRAGRARRR